MMVIDLSSGKIRNINAALTITSVQRADDQTDRSELNTIAYYRYAPDKIEIHYPELDEDGEPCGKTKITIFPNRIVTVDKIGFVVTKMVLEAGKAHFATYDTIAGSLDMIVSAIDIIPRLDSQGGRLYLRYMLELNGDVTTENILDLQIRMQS